MLSNLNGMYVGDCDKSFVCVVDCFDMIVDCVGM